MNKTRLQPLLDNIGDNSKNLELVSAELLDADSIDKACEDCDLVVHVASPLVMKDPKDENDVLGPAINGTENVINACFKNNVKRVVVTSSCISILDWNNLNEADETQWAPNLSLYILFTFNMIKRLSFYNILKIGILFRNL